MCRWTGSLTLTLALRLACYLSLSLHCYSYIITDKDLIHYCAFLFCPKTYPRNFDELRGSKLFLFFSSLDISEDHILLIKYVNERIQRERRDLYKTVWIPIAENLNWEAHRVDNYLLGIARRLSCYTARPHPACIRNIKDTYRLHNRNNYLVLVEMDQRGHANEYDPDTTIVRERMARFGFRNWRKK